MRKRRCSLTYFHRRVKGSKDSAAAVLSVAPPLVGGLPGEAARDMRRASRTTAVGFLLVRKNKDIIFTVKSLILAQDER